MEMIQIRIDTRGMWFPEKPSLKNHPLLEGEPRTSRFVDLFATDCATPHPQENYLKPSTILIKFEKC